MQWLYLSLMTMVGIGLTVQGAANARLSQALAAPTLSAAVNFAVGLLVLIAVTASGVFGRGNLAGAGEAPWWAWIGGVIGAAFVTSAIVAIPKIGTAAMFSAVIFGQIAGSLILDHFGWLALKPIPIDPWRLLGAALTFIGVIMVNYRV